MVATHYCSLFTQGKAVERMKYNINTGFYLKITNNQDFRGGPVVKNPPSNTGEAGSIPGWGTKVQHAMGQLSPRAATTEPTCSGAREPQLESPRAATREPVRSGAHTPQLERSPRAATKT